MSNASVRFSFQNDDKLIFCILSKGKAGLWLIWKSAEKPLGNLGELHQNSQPVELKSIIANVSKD